MGVGGGGGMCMVGGMRGHVYWCGGRDAKSF